ncbi:MAG TPA: energy-coupling factor ABC transporter permease [Bryobacteraceae bacterium]|jgi:cobalt/nickel transport system permease protein|nr:energy-coupling factor ABC transporter permease [Bryobacteraceae bacterium]
MHIPDGFLSTPVWATLDLASAPAVAWVARRAQRNTNDNRIPLLGVMGAFVFAAQMVNFPVGPGTSGHLVGGALLTIVLGPAAASLALTAILVLQALIFQDGGVLALGANVFNMALAGVAAAYLAYRIWGQSSRPGAMFAAGALSVMTSACLALGQLLISGVPMAGGVLWASLGLFLVSAIMEGAITVAAVRAIERLNPAWVSGPQPASSRTVAAVGLAALVLLVIGTLIASSAPDGIQRLTGQGVDSMGWAQRTMGALAGIAMIFALCYAAGKLKSRRRSA